jgi:Kef-type K+ transport system membrane component KefB
VTRWAAGSGETLARFGQPALVGELLAGVPLGLVAHQFSGSLPMLAGVADAEVLVDLGKRDTPMGRTILSAAVFDDVFSLVRLAMLTAVLKAGEMPVIVRDRFSAVVLITNLATPVALQRTPGSPDDPEAQVDTRFARRKQV